MKRLVIHWLPLLAWAVLIFILSSIPSLESGFTLTWDVILRKMAHAGEYAVLAILFAHAFGRMTLRNVILAAFFAILYAASDEFHQTFVPGREGTPYDVLVDGLGAVIGASLLWRFAQIRKLIGRPLSR